MSLVSNFSPSRHAWVYCSRSRNALPRFAGFGLAALLSVSVSFFLSGCGGIGTNATSPATTQASAGTSDSGNSGSSSSGSGASSGSSSGSGSSGSSGSGSDSGSGSGSGSTGSSGSGSGSSGSGSGSSSGSSGSAGSSSGSGSDSGSGSTGSSGSGSGSSGSGSGSGSSSGSSGSSSTPAATGTTYSNLQTTAGNWQSFAQIGPDFIDCAANCSSATWKQVFGISDPSKSGNATQFELDPLLPYADVLYTSGVIGVNSPQVPDGNHQLLPTLHNYTYDTDFYVQDAAVFQALEFDVSVWMEGVAGMTFGTQCNNLGDGDWDIWNNQSGHWTDAGVPCKTASGWNHVTVQLERESNNYTLYKSITLNGTTYTINKDFPSISAPAGWWGINLNFQMDSNYEGSQVTTYLDNLSLTVQ